MKLRIFNSVFALWLLVLQVGFSSNIHFCGGEAASVELKIITEFQSPCGTSCCGKEAEKSPCCDDNTLDLQVEKFTKVDNLVISFTFCELLIRHNFNLDEVIYLFHPSKLTLDVENPKTSIPLYTLYSQRVYYA